MSDVVYIFPKLFTAEDAVTQMSKMSLFRASFGSQRGNGSQTLLESARQHFYPFAS